MKPEIKEKWIAALESGDYPQTMGKLQDDIGFCCLGVLCDLAVKDGVINPPDWDAYAFAYYYPEAGVDEPYGGWNKGTLPAIVQRWAGLESDNPGVKAEVTRHDDAGKPHKVTADAALAELNDHHNYDFKRLAQLIREQL